MKFTENYEKLGWIVFTTIRKNTGRYKLWNRYKIQTPNGDFYARIIGLLPIKKEDITPILAEVDAEMSKGGLISMLESWYGKKFDNYILITLLSD